MYFLHQILWNKPLITKSIVNGDRVQFGEETILIFH